jgi:catechol-2,3-dioxygenase
MSASLGWNCGGASRVVYSSVSPRASTGILVCSDYSTAAPAKPRAEASTLDHFAFEIPLSAYESERIRLEGLGLSVRTREFPGLHWRALFVKDPEGNTVELVCYDTNL